MHPGPAGEAPAPVPLGVWLETGAGDGRVVAWLPDLSGVAGLGRTASRAETTALTATARVRAWLEARGDDAGLPPLGRVEVAGEVSAEPHPDGSVRRATLPSDRRALGRGAVEAAIRRLEWLREDLLAVATRLEAPTAAGAPPAPTGTTRETTAEDGVRRLAVALDRLGRLGDADDGTETTDERGETRTLAKVVRLSLQQGFADLWALELRLARADGTADRVDVRLDRRPDGPAMSALLRSVGWDARAARVDALDEAIRGTPEFAAAWDGDRLVGTARSLTDGSLYAHIATVVVDPRYQGLGVGERLMHALVDGRDGVRFGLSAAPGMAEWYARLGFEPDERAMVRHRRRP